jgi:hypothetical protein
MREGDPVCNECCIKTGLAVIHELDIGLYGNYTCSCCKRSRNTTSSPVHFPTKRGWRAFKRAMRTALGL